MWERELDDGSTADESLENRISQDFAFFMIFPLTCMMFSVLENSLINGSTLLWSFSFVYSFKHYENTHSGSITLNKPLFKMEIFQSESFLFVYGTKQSDDAQESFLCK